MADGNLTIQSLEIVIEHKASEAANSTTNLVTSLRKLQNTLSKLSPVIATFTNNMTEMTAAIAQADDSKIVAISTAFASLRTSINRIRGIKVPDFSSAVSTASKDAVQGMKNLELAAEGVEQATEGAVPSLKSIKNAIKDVGKEAEKSGKKGKTGANGLAKFAKSIGRIAMYRAIRAAIKAVINAVKEGVNNFYEFDKAANGTFAQALDSAATSAQYLKNSLISAVAPALTAIIPLITQISDGIAEFSNSIAVMTAQAKGLEQVTIAKKDMKEFADNASKAKNAIQGFDELNTLSSGTDTSGMFETITVGSEEAQKYTDSFVGSIVGMFKELLPVIKKVGKFLINAFKGSAGTLKSVFDGLTKIVEAIDGIISEGFLDDILDNITNVSEAVSNMIGGILPYLAQVLTTLSPLIQAINDNVMSLISQLVGALAPILGTIIQTALVMLNNFLTPLVPLLTWLVNTIMPPIIEILTTVFTVIGYITEALKPVFDILSAIFAELLEPGIVTLSAIIRILTGDFKGAFDMLGQYFDQFISRWKKRFEDFVPFMKNIGIKIVNALIGGLNKLGNFTIPGLKIGGVQIWADTQVKLFNIPRIPEYATGGFPEDGLFFANSNEMVGQFTNGRSAVVNNQQIVEGISDGVYNAVVAAMSASEGNQPLNLNVYLDGKQLAAAVNRQNYMSGARIATGGIIS